MNERFSATKVCLKISMKKPIGNIENIEILIDTAEKVYQQVPNGEIPMGKHISYLIDASRQISGILLISLINIFTLLTLQ